MRSSVVKRSVIVGKRKTSVSLEDEFWTDVKEIAPLVELHVLLCSAS